MHISHQANCVLSVNLNVENATSAFPQCFCSSAESFCSSFNLHVADYIMQKQLVSSMMCKPYMNFLRKTGWILTVKFSNFSHRTISSSTLGKSAIFASILDLRMFRSSSCPWSSSATDDSQAVGSSAIFTDVQQLLGENYVNIANLYG